MIVDLIIIAVIAICIVMGVKRGLILSMISVLSLVIALTVGYLLMPAVSGLINMTPIPDKVDGVVYEYINDALGAEAESAGYKDAIEDSALPSFVKNKVENVVDDSVEQTTSEISHKASKSVTSAIVKIMAVALVAIVVFIILLSTKFIWKGLRKITVLRKIDTVGGALFGVGQGVLTVSGIMLIVSVFTSLGLMTGLAATIQSSFLGGFFYEYNFLGLLIALFIG